MSSIITGKGDQLFVTGVAGIVFLLYGLKSHIQLSNKREMKTIEKLLLFSSYGKKHMELEFEKRKSHVKSNKKTLNIWHLLAKKGNHEIKGEISNALVSQFSR